MSVTAIKENDGSVQYMLGLVVHSNGGELMKESTEWSRQERERISYQDFDVALRVRVRGWFYLLVHMCPLLEQIWLVQG